MQVNAGMSSLAGSAWKVFKNMQDNTPHQLILPYDRQAVKPHIPMIKFRKGGLTELVRGTPEPVTTAGPAPAGSTAPPAQTPVVLEEWQVPLRYRRELITEEEIEYINRGGPA